ncbi:NTP transferase domain-containing protein [candidate division KSB1 bacterium]|nr:NTP transferase domain-containing protein [candidate division KSB1 bacterium]
MKALIIAAGHGSRLTDLTNGEAKPLFPLLGLSLIERIILTAKNTGIKEFVIVVGYSGDQIKAALGDGRRYKLKIDYIENGAWQKGNAVSVLEAKTLLNENFVLLMSDHIFDERILKQLVNHDLKSSVILAVDRKKPLPGDTNVLENNGKIVKIGKQIEQTNCVDTGIFLCSPKIFDYIEEEVKEGRTELADGIARAANNEDAEIFDITSINPYISSMRKEIKPFWVDTDKKEDIVKAEKLLIENACKGRNDLLATYVNKPIENFIVKHVANKSITPNQITLLTNIIAYAATILFFTGNLLLASLLTFVVSFMDGVDGKLSRVKLSSSNIGKMEHAFDFLFEHSWYIALAFYLSKTCGTLAILLTTFIVLFDGFTHFCGQGFGKAYKGCALSDYGKLERIFRKFDGRKNSYIIFILVGVLFNVPFYSLIAVTFWSFVSALFYCVRTMKHLYVMDSEEYEQDFKMYRIGFKNKPVPQGVSAQLQI